MGGNQAKHSKKGCGGYKDLSQLPSPLINLYRFGHLPLPGTKRESSLQVEIFLINANVYFRSITSIPFSEILFLLFFKNNQLKIILMPKGIFWVTYSAPLQWLIYVSDEVVLANGRRL